MAICPVYYCSIATTHPAVLCHTLPAIQGDVWPQVTQVERRTNDQEVGGSARIFLAQPYPSCLHPCASVTKQDKLVPV